MPSVDTIVGSIFGGIMIFYLISSTFEDASDDLTTIPDNTSGGKIIKLLPLFLAFGVVFAVYKLFKTPAHK